MMETLDSAGVKALIGDTPIRQDVLEAALARHEADRAAHAIGEAAAVGDLEATMRWAKALEDFMNSGDGFVLHACFCRAVELLRDVPEVVIGGLPEKPQPSLYREREERELAMAAAVARHEAGTALREGNYPQAMRTLAVLRPFVQAFFARIDFKDAEPALRDNRLKLVRELRDTLCLVGDLSKIEARTEV